MRSKEMVDMPSLEEQQLRDSRIAGQRRGEGVQIGVVSAVVTDRCDYGVLG